MTAATNRRQVVRAVLVNSAISGVICFAISFGVGIRTEPVGSALIASAVAFITGFLVPAIIIGLEQIVFRSRGFKRLPFLVAFAIKVSSYLCVGMAVYLVIGLLAFPQQVLDGANIGGALGITVGISLLFNISIFLRQFLGKLFFKLYLTSRYHRARQIDGVFLFIDVAGSTSLGERLAPEAFFLLLNEFISAVEAVVDRHGGLVYKYVGDCIIAVWDGSARSAPRVYEAVREIRQTVADSQPAFQAISGERLGFTMGVHCGPVIVGEIGQERREIGYLGDTVNTTQRVQSACKALGASILLSERFVAAMNGSARGAADSLVRHPDVRLAGKEEPMTLFGLPEPSAAPI